MVDFTLTLRISSCYVFHTAFAVAFFAVWVVAAVANPFTAASAKIEKPDENGNGVSLAFIEGFLLFLRSLSDFAKL